VASGAGTGPVSLHSLSSAGSGAFVAFSGAAELDIMSSGIFATGKYKAEMMCVGDFGGGV
jgi:hypothetical protein